MEHRQAQEVLTVYSGQERVGDAPLEQVVGGRQGFVRPGSGSYRKIDGICRFPSAAGWPKEPSAAEP